MKKPLIVAFSGRAGSGKDTAADELRKLVQCNNTSVTTISHFTFASTLKRIALAALNINERDAEYLKRAPEIKVANGLDLRKFYNTLGDAIKSHFGQDTWVKITLGRIEETIGAINPDLVLVTDVRYNIEHAALIKFCEDRGFDLHLIKMVNLNNVSNKPSMEHASEFLVDSIDEDILIEASSVEEIQIKIKEFYDSI